MKVGKSMIKKLTKISVNIFFSYIFFVSTILIAFVINSFFALPDTSLPQPISFLVENRVYSSLLIIIWLFLCVLKNYYDDIKQKMNNYDLIIKEKERQIEITSGVLEAKYGDIADSINRNRLSKILKNTISRYPFVEACHLYNYELHRVNSHVRIKVKFNLGEEQECTGINVIKQNYYDIDKNIFKKINKLSNFEDKKKPKDFSCLMDKTFNEIDSSEIHESLKFRLNEIIVFIFCKFFKMDNIGFEESENSTKFDSFRTGILGSILTHRGYIYRYQRKKIEKKGRVYFTSPIILDTEYILNLAIDGQGLNSSELNDTILEVASFIHQEYNRIVGGNHNEN